MSTVNQAIDRIALIGNFLPRRCGLATFTTHCYQAMKAQFPDLAIDVYAMDDHPGRYDYPPEVTATIPQDDLTAYLSTARAIEASGAQAVWVQHEYGIYGGSAGEHLLALLDRVTLPVIVTLHTILEHPSADERRVLEALLRRASKVIVMAERGRDILIRVHGANSRNIAMIYHGVPDRSLLNPDVVKPRFGWEGRHVVLTFGLLAPNKGIETMIAAMPAILERDPTAHYAVLGATHPNLVAHEGEAYRERLIAQADALGIADHVEFIDGFIDEPALLDYLQAADIYVTPYVNPAQITSGTLSFAVSMGKPVVSTPYVHATEILADDHGMLVDFGDVAGFSNAVGGLLADETGRLALADRAYQRGRTMLWQCLAESVMGVLDEAVAARPRRIAAGSSEMAPLTPDLTAVERMSDATGMLQHSIYSIPDRRHGYCIDDNARALILMCRIDPVDEVIRDKWASVYASFVQYAWNPDARRFRNFMNFDRTWCEDVGSEDSNGRALWSLGVVASEGRARKHRDWAAAMFDQTASLAFDLGSPRAQAFAILGAAAMRRGYPDHPLATRILEQFGEQLVALCETNRRPDWQWFEIVLAYDNARLPEALIRAGHALGRQDFVACGIETLEWIVSRQTSPDGRFRAVGTESFGREFAEPLPFDQQPLEAQATVEACAAAFEATGDHRWMEEAMRAYRWYLGGNDLELPLATPQDGGCFDGLQPTGLNRNQGAESILALQLANCAISTLSKAASNLADPPRAIVG